ncbi:MAG: hypothetical protein AAF591_06690 [Verrucomicrobiota bacterium]
MSAINRKADFERRADYSPDMVYRHQVRGWRYIPVHPFFEELPPHDPKNEKIYESGLVEAYWEMNDDVVFLNVSLDSVALRPAGLYIRTRADGGNEAHAVLGDVYHVSREIFEDAMDQVYATSQLEGIHSDALMLLRRGASHGDQ